MQRNQVLNFCRINSSFFFSHYLQTQLNIYRLQPNTTYRFRVWATNNLGPGDYAECLTTTKLLSNDEGNDIICLILKDVQTFIALKVLTTKS